MAQDVEKIYKKLFKEKGVNVKKIEIKEFHGFSTMFIHLPGKVFYHVRWEQSVNALIFGRLVNKNLDGQEGQENQDVLIKNPTALKLVDAITDDYKSFIKERGFLKQMISKVMEESFNL